MQHGFCNKCGRAQERAPPALQTSFYHYLQCRGCSLSADSTSPALFTSQRKELEVGARCVRLVPDLAVARLHEVAAMHQLLKRCSCTGDLFMPRLHAINAAAWSSARASNAYTGKSSPPAPACQQPMASRLCTRPVSPAPAGRLLHAGAPLHAGRHAPHPPAAPAHGRQLSRCRGPGPGQPRHSAVLPRRRPACHPA